MPSLYVQDVTVSEADGFADVVVRLDVAGTTAITVGYTMANNSALNSYDYTFAEGTLNFGAGETSKTVRVPIINDTGAEGPEEFGFSLRNATNATLGRDKGRVYIVDNDTRVETPQLFVDDVVVDEKQGTASFVVRLGSHLGTASNSTVTVNYSTQDSTAIAGQDYAAKSGTLTFAPGESAKTVVVNLSDDTLAEPLERFNLVLSSPVNAAIGDGVAVADIGWSDGTGSAQPRISVADVTVGEADGYADVVVSLHAPSTSVVGVGFTMGNVSALNSYDYRYYEGTLNFAPGETVKTVRVPLINDTSAEGPHEFSISLRNATNATLGRESARVTIIDNDTIVDTPQLFVSDVVVDEKQGTASFVVRLGSHLGQATNSTITATYSTQDGTAVAGQDYVAKSGTLSFAPGESAKTVVVDLSDDTLAEPLERFNLVLGSPVNAAIADGVAVAEIGLSDGTGSAQPRISAADVTVGEADGYADVVVSLHAPSTNAVGVGFTMGNVSALNSYDYRYYEGTLNFAPGETVKTVRVPLINDTSAEGPHEFSFSLRNATNGAISREMARVSIVDNDTIVDTPQLHVGDLTVDEKQGTASFVVRLGNNLGQATNSTITVNYSTQDGTAIAGQDYVAKSGALSFAPGESAKTVVIDLVDDALAEPLERFNLVLGSPVNAAIGDGVAVAEVALSDGNGSAQPRIGVADVVVGEADGYANVVVSLNAPSASAVSVGFTMGNGSALNSYDYRYYEGTLNFAPGETAKTVRVPLITDTAAESAESFTVSLRNPTNATLERTTAQVTILDDDGARPLLSHGRSNDVYTIDSTALDFIEAANGGFDVVRSSVSFTLPATLEGVILTGSASNATGNDVANFFQGNARNNNIDGLGGVDTMAYGGRDSDYAISGSVASRSVSSAAEGSDTLLSIERLRFSNTVQAYDTLPGGSTYGAYAMLNAAFDAAPSAALLSQWTVQLDQLHNLRDLAQAMIHYYAPGVPNDALVAHLWGTIVEVPITPAQLTEFVGLIDNGTFTQASLVEFVTTYPLNTDEIAGIVGQPLALDPAWFPLPGG